MGNANLEIGNGLNLIKGSLTDLDANTYCANAGIGASTQTPTAYDQAATFNGTNQYLSVANNSSLQLNGTPFTISAWVYITGASGGIDNQILGKCTFPSGSIDYSLAIAANSTNPRFYWYDFGYQEIQGNSLIVNTWNHIVVSYNGSTATMYVNAVNNVSSALTIFNYGGNFSIGRLGDYPQYLSGSVAGVGIWKRALSSTEITSLYNAGNGLTYSGIQQAGLTTNLVSYWELNETSGASLYYDSVTATGNNLTPYNTPTNSVGPIATATASSQSLINNFVKGIKGLGLWYNMTSWLLKSSQNASSTQTALSLGGLVSQSASLVNNPAWASNGIVLNGSNQYLDAGLNSALNFTSQPFSAIVKATANSISNNPTLVGTGAGFAADGWYFALINNGKIEFLSNQSGNFQAQDSTTLTLLGNSISAFSRSSSSVQIYQNGTNYTGSSVAISNPSSASQSLRFGQSVNSSPLNGIISDVLIFNTALSQAQMQAVNSLIP